MAARLFASREIQSQSIAHTREETVPRSVATSQEKYTSGNSSPLLLHRDGKATEKIGFDDEQAAYFSGTLLEAGSDTTSNTLYGFVQAMGLFPEVQQKAQEEIDKIVGHERMPNMDDEPKMQYIRGCVKESLWWMPTTIVGSILYALTQDDEYMGYRLPKGAGVVSNIIHMDPARYPEQRKFNPDRYQHDLKTAYCSAVDPDVSERDHFTFGAGRRICQGMHLAERSLFLGISRLLWGFDTEPAVNTDGVQIIPDPEKYTQGFLVMPEPFQTKITPRSEKKADRVRQEWHNAQRQLDPVTQQWMEIPQGMALPGN